jgi:regulator of RNase E activity RraA
MNYPEMFKKLSKNDTPTISNALQVFDKRFALVGYGKPGLALKSNCDKIIVGFAITAMISSLTVPTDQEKNNRFALYKAACDAEYQTVICIKDTDNPAIGSFWGEMQTSIFKSEGAVGTITDGGVRDLDSSEKLDFPFFATTNLVSRANIHVTDVQVPVTICGQVVKPNDIVHADKHGFIVIPAEYAEKVISVCEQLGEAENLLLKPCQQAISENRRPSYEEIITWYKACNEAKAKIKETL